MLKDEVNPLIFNSFLETQLLHQFSQNIKNADGNLLILSPRITSTNNPKAGELLVAFRDKNIPQKIPSA